MIQVQNLSVRRQQRTILEAINLAVNCGELVGLIGPNGAGKSTLLRCLAGDLEPTSGQVLLHDKPLTSWSRADLSRCRAVMPQQQTVPFPFQCQQIVAMGRHPYRRQLPPPVNAAVVDAVLAATGVDALRARSYQALSGGEAQRVQMARSLAQIWPGAERLEPGLILLDEPTASLDPRFQHEGLALIRQLTRQQLAGVAVLHDLNLAAQYCDRIAILRDGALYAWGRPRDVLTPAILRAVYQIEVSVIDHPEQGAPMIVTRGPKGDKHVSGTDAQPLRA
jgi:iron complex transport system ATP-binding protein